MILHKQTPADEANNSMAPTYAKLCSNSIVGLPDIIANWLCYLKPERLSELHIQFPRT